MTPDRTLDFYFDFISPFGYLASLRIDELAARYERPCRWNSMLLGVSVLKVMGMKPLPTYPLKGPYLKRDMQRYMRRHNIVLNRCETQASPIPPARAFNWFKSRDERLAVDFAKAALHAYWREQTDIGRPEVVGDIAVRYGANRDEVLAAIASGGDGDKLLRAAIDRSVAAGVFGSPFFIVDDEPFFGLEKMELLEEWLSSGGW